MCRKVRREWAYLSAVKTVVFFHSGGLLTRSQNVRHNTYMVTQRGLTFFGLLSFMFLKEHFTRVKLDVIFWLIKHIYFSCFAFKKARKFLLYPGQWQRSVNWRTSWDDAEGQPQMVGVKLVQIYPQTPCFPARGRLVNPRFERIWVEWMIGGS